MDGWAHFIAALEVSAGQLRLLSSDFQQVAEAALAGRDSSLSALRTYQGLPTGRERGTFLALDFGGTNVRASRVRLTGDGGFSIESKIARSLRGIDYDFTRADVTMEALFDFIAGLVGEVAGDGAARLGFTFSFAAEQISAREAGFLAWSKEMEVRCPRGTRINAELERALGRAGLSGIEPVALVNDTTATLLASVYRGVPTRIGIVCGTGFNMCFYEPGGKIYNLEAGGFDGAPCTAWDEALDRDSHQPGSQLFEKMIGGRYLSEVFRRVLEDYLGRSLPAFTTRDMNGLLSGAFQSLDVLGVELSEEQMEGVRAIGVAVIRRAVQFVGAASAGLLSHLVAKGGTGGAVAVEGSMVEKLPGVTEQVAETIARLTGTENPRVAVSRDGASLGAAVAAAL